MKGAWPLKKIGDVCTLMTGGTPSKTKREYFGGAIRWLVSGDIHRREIIDCEGRITEDGLRNSNAKYLPINSVLIALNGQGKTRGSVAILRTRATCNQSLVSIYPKNLNELLPEFIYTNLHGRYQEIRKLTGDSGNDRRGLNMSLVRNIEIPIAPVADQKHIVETLNNVLSGIATAKGNAQKNLQNAWAVFESHLHSVFSKGGAGWVEKTLAQICEKITDGTHQTPTYFNSGFTFLSSKNVTSGKINWENVRHIDSRQHFEMQKRVSPRMNDILLAKNGTTGVAAIVDRDLPFDIYVSLALLRPLNVILPAFLLHFINSPVAKLQFDKRLKGIGVPNLHLEEIREVRVCYPESKTEQQKILSKLDRLSKETHCLTTIYESKLAALEALQKSVLHQAFSGNL